MSPFRPVVVESFPAWLQAGCSVVGRMVDGSVDAALRPPSWAKEGNGSEGRNRLNRRQKDKTQSWVGCGGSCLFVMGKLELHQVAVLMCKLANKISMD